MIMNFITKEFNNDKTSSSDFCVNYSGKSNVLIEKYIALFLLVVMLISSWPLTVYGNEEDPTPKEKVVLDNNLEEQNSWEESKVLEAENSQKPIGPAFLDISGHWAESYITKAADIGIVKGYKDKNFMPNLAVTRAEFVTMLNKVLGLTEENMAELSFSDVNQDEWYYEEISKAVYAEYICGFNETKFKPKSLITRQEVSSIIAKCMPANTEIKTSVLAEYPDYEKISGWAVDSFAFSIENGYLQGYSNGKLEPRSLLTRAQAVTILTKLWEDIKE